MSHRSRKVETIHVSIDRGKDKRNVVCAYNEMLATKKIKVRTHAAPRKDPETFLRAQAANHGEAHGTWMHSYNISRRGKSTVAGDTLAIVRGWGRACRESDCLMGVLVCPSCYNNNPHTRVVCGQQKLTSHCFVGWEVLDRGAG